LQVGGEREYGYGRWARASQRAEAQDIFCGLTRRSSECCEALRTW
jgi:hypothetical protein